MEQAISQIKKPGAAPTILKNFKAPEPAQTEIIRPEPKKPIHKTTPADQYLRIGTCTYKKLLVPGINEGDYKERLKKWNVVNIKEDHDEDTYRFIRKNMKKYEDFCVVPGHVDFQPEVHGIGGVYYNQYKPLPCTEPKSGTIDVTLKFLQHIFGDQLEIGLDYLQLLYLKPTQQLYILCLVSRERNTGKSTFLKWLNKLFGENMTYNNSGDFDGRFNGDWTDKLLVAVDETFIDNKATVERIKNLSTADKFKTEEKQKDKYETDFFAKFIFASNNDDSFLPIDEEEPRFWVRNIPKLESDNTFILQQLSQEIPAFFYYLKNRKLNTPEPKTRMWHSPDQVWTEALDKAKAGSRSILEKELITVLSEEFNSINEELVKIDENPCLRFTLKDLIVLLKDQTTLRPNQNTIKDILTKKWGLTQENSSYKVFKWILDTPPSGPSKHILVSELKKGRYYTFPASFFKE